MPASTPSTRRTSIRRWVPGNKGGESETIIGNWMKSRGNRDKIVVITKVGSDMGQAARSSLQPLYRARPSRISLQRLRTDHIDLYLSHWPDETTPYDETLGAYQRCVEQGKVRWRRRLQPRCAASSRRRSTVADRRQLPRYEVLQPEYNLYDRSTLRRPAARSLHQREEIGVITYFSARARASSPANTAAEADLGKATRGGGCRRISQRRGRCASSLRSTRSRRGMTRKPAEVALAWVDRAAGRHRADRQRHQRGADRQPHPRRVAEARPLRDIAELDKASAA